MKCESAQPQLHAYLDGELDRPAVEALETHLTTCAACGAELRGLEELRGALRALPRPRAPAELRRRLREVEQTSSDASGSRSGWRAARWAMAASLVLGFALGAAFMGARFSGGPTADTPGMLARDLLTSHLRALAAASPVDVISEDRHTVKPWFAGKIGISPPVIDLGSQDFPLLGGRIDYVGDGRTAVIVYGHRKHIIDVYMTAGSLDEVAGSQQRQGYSLTACRLAGQSAWVVTDLDVDTLRRFTSLLGCGP